MPLPTFPAPSSPFCSVPLSPGDPFYCRLVTSLGWDLYIWQERVDQVLEKVFQVGGQMFGEWETKSLDFLFQLYMILKACTRDATFSALAGAVSSNTSPFVLPQTLPWLERFEKREALQNSQRQQELLHSMIRERLESFDGVTDTNVEEFNRTQTTLAAWDSALSSQRWQNSLPQDWTGKQIGEREEKDRPNKGNEKDEEEKEESRNEDKESTGQGCTVEEECLQKPDDFVLVLGCSTQALTSLADPVDLTCPSLPSLSPLSSPSPCPAPASALAAIPGESAMGRIGRRNPNSTSTNPTKNVVLKMVHCGSWTAEVQQGHCKEIVLKEKQMEEESEEESESHGNPTRFEKARAQKVISKQHSKPQRKGKKQTQENSKGREKGKVNKRESTTKAQDKRKNTKAMTTTKNMTKSMTKSITKIITKACDSTSPFTSCGSPLTLVSSERKRQQKKDKKNKKDKKDSGERKQKGSQQAKEGSEEQRFGGKQKQRLKKRMGKRREEFEPNEGEIEKLVLVDAKFSSLPFPHDSESETAAFAFARAVDAGVRALFFRAVHRQSFVALVTSALSASSPARRSHLSSFQACVLKTEVNSKDSAWVEFVDLLWYWETLFPLTVSLVLSELHDVQERITFSEKEKKKEKEKSQRWQKLMELLHLLTELQYLPSCHLFPQSPDSPVKPSLWRKGGKGEKERKKEEEECLRWLAQRLRQFVQPPGDFTKLRSHFWREVAEETEKTSATAAGFNYRGATLGQLRVLAALVSQTLGFVNLAILDVPREQRIALDLTRLVEGLAVLSLLAHQLSSLAHALSSPFQRLEIGGGLREAWLSDLKLLRPDSWMSKQPMPEVLGHAFGHARPTLLENQRKAANITRLLKFTVSLGKRFLRRTTPGKSHKTDGEACVCCPCQVLTRLIHSQFQES